MACRSSCPYLGEIGLCRFNKHMLPMNSLRQRLEPVQDSGSMRNGATQYIHSLMTKLWKRMSHALLWRIVNKISDCHVLVLVFIFGVHFTVPTMLTALRNFFEWSVYFFLFTGILPVFGGVWPGEAGLACQGEMASGRCVRAGSGGLVRAQHSLLVCTHLERRSFFL